MIMMKIKTITIMVGVIRLSLEKWKCINSPCEPRCHFLQLSPRLPTLSASLVIQELYPTSFVHSAPVLPKHSCGSVQLSLTQILPENKDK
jgi:hypothetical protein